MASRTLPFSSLADLPGIKSHFPDLGNGYAGSYGQHTTESASDTVETGLGRVLGIYVTLESDPVAGCSSVTAAIGDQVGTPASGSVVLKTWQPTASGDTAPTAATTFGKKINWLALGFSK